MDPVTAIGLVASIIQLIDVTAKAVKYLNDVKDAPKDRQRLALEVTSLLTLLTNLRYQMEEAEATDTWFICLRSLGEENGLLDQFSGAMEALVKKLKPEGGMQRYSRALIWTLEKKEVMEILNKIERLKSTITIALQEVQLALALATKTKVDEMGEQMHKLTNAHEDQVDQALVDWLSPLDFIPMQNELSSRRQQGTGQWLLESKEFLNWCSGANGVLWCSGMPGAGKTTLVSTVIDHLRDSLDLNIGLGFIYCDYKHQTAQTPVNLFGGLLKQFSQERPSICNGLRGLYEGKKEPSLDEIAQALRTSTGIFSKVFIIVDALDECSEIKGSRTIMLEELGVLSNMANIMITSRPHVNVEEYFQSIQNLEIIASDHDVRRYVEQRISGAPRLARIVKSETGLKQRITDAVAESIKGMFLLARLHMDSLATKATRNAVLDALKNLPKGLDDTYEEAMQRIDSQNDDDRELARKVLYWTTCARRPLTVEELQHALAVKIGTSRLDEGDIVDEEILFSVCAGLVTTSQESKIVRFIHYTTQRHFEGVRLRYFPEAEQSITKTCLTYLSFDTFSDGSYSTDYVWKIRLDLLQTRLQRNVFLLYAARYWDDYLNEDGLSDLKELLYRFVQNFDALMCSFHARMAPEEYLARATRAVYSIPIPFFGLQVVAQLDLETLSIRVREYKSVVERKDQHKSTPLTFTPSSGQEADVVILSDKDTEIRPKYNIRLHSIWLGSRRGVPHFYQQVMPMDLDKETTRTEKKDTEP